MYNILLVDDDLDVLRTTAKLLETKKYNVTTFSSSKEAILDAVNNDYDLLILDYMMPNIDGKSFVEIYCSVKKSTNVLIYSAMKECEFEMLSKDICDFVSKEDDPRVFLLRVERALNNINSNSVMDFEVLSSEKENIILDPQSYSVKKDGEDIDIPNNEFMLLSLLLSHKGKTLSRDYIHEMVWKSRGYELEDYRVIDIYILKIRKKLNISCIKSVRGVGYVWREK